MDTERIMSFDDLVELLERHPQYRARLRQSILDEEFQRLPAHVAKLTDQTRTLSEVTTSLAERMDQLTERMDQLTKRMDQLTKRMDQLTERMDQLTERMDQLTVRLDQLTVRVDQLTERVNQLAERMDQMAELLKEFHGRLLSLEKRTDRLTGDEAERRFQARAPAYFGHLLRRARVIDNSDLGTQVDDAIDSGTFAEADRESLLMLDVVVRGRDVETREDRYLAVEVSSGIGETDILRATDRAVLLAKLTGVPAVPVVAGYSISARFRSLAAERQVRVVIAEEPK